MRFPGQGLTLCIACAFKAHIHGYVSVYNVCECFVLAVRGRSRFRPTHASNSSRQARYDVSIRYSTQRTPADRPLAPDSTTPAPYLAESVPLLTANLCGRPVRKMLKGSWCSLHAQKSPTVSEASHRFAGRIFICNRLCPVTLDGRRREEQQDLHCKGHYANAEAYCCVLTHENY